MNYYFQQAEIFHISLYTLNSPRFGHVGTFLLLEVHMVLYHMVLDHMVLNHMVLDHMVLDDRQH